MPRSRFTLFVFATLTPMFSAAAQPNPPLRACAEWDPASGALIRYPLGVPMPLVVEIARQDTVFLIASPTDLADAQAAIAASNANPANIEYILAPTNSRWTRDWGPPAVFDAAGQLHIVDPYFDGYPLASDSCGSVSYQGGSWSADDTAPAAIAAYLNLPTTAPQAFLTGGNALFDGLGSALSTCLLIDENAAEGIPAPAVDAALSDHLGIATHNILTNYEAWGIQHIDCLLKPLDARRLLVKRVPTDHAEFAAIERAMSELQQLTTPFGEPYEILRIDCPRYSGQRLANYTNSLILNDRVFVPLFEIDADEAALRTFRAALPGYEVIGIPYYDWLSNDALHCRVRAVWDQDMVWLAHDPPSGPIAADAPFALMADAALYSGAPLAATSRVRYRIEEGAWADVPVVVSGAELSAVLPAFPAGARVDYYFDVADVDGNAARLPRGSAAFELTVDPGALAIEVVDPVARVTPWTQHQIRATITADAGELVPGSVVLHYRLDGGAFRQRSMAAIGGDTYAAELPRVTCDSVVEYFVAAEGVASGVRTAPASAPVQLYSPVVGALVESVLLDECFETGLPTDWSATGLWHVTDVCGGGFDGGWAAYFGQDGTCNYATGQPARGVLAAPPLALPEIPADGSITLTYQSRRGTEGDAGFDTAWLRADGAQRDIAPNTNAWTTRTVSLADLAGETVELAWEFDSSDRFYNSFLGWQVDCIAVTALVSDCSLPAPGPGDLNNDGSVDGLDWAALEWVVLGPAVTTAPATIDETDFANSDLDGDNDVDIADLAAFQLQFGG